MDHKLCWGGEIIINYDGVDAGCTQEKSNTREERIELEK